MRRGWLVAGHPVIVSYYVNNSHGNVLLLFHIMILATHSLELCTHMYVQVHTHTHKIMV